MPTLRGRVDKYGRALVPIRVRHPDSPHFVEAEAWIDTGFTGLLSLTPDQVVAMNLPAWGVANTRLADGSLRALPAHRCTLEWFGAERAVRILGAPSRFALLGIHVLENTILTINYDTYEVFLTTTANFGK